MVAEFARPVLDACGQHPGEAVAAGIGRDVGVHQVGGEGLRLVVARRADQDGGADDLAVQAGDEQFPLRHQQHAAEIGFQRAPARRVDPAEAAAVDDGGVGRLAQGVQVVVGELASAARRTVSGSRRRMRGCIRASRQGVQRRKLARMRMPTSWLFSTWNCVPARLPATTMAGTAPP